MAWLGYTAGFFNSVPYLTAPREELPPASPGGYPTEKKADREPVNPGFANPLVTQSARIRDSPSS